MSNIDRTEALNWVLEKISAKKKKQSKTPAVKKLEPVKIPEQKSTKLTQQELTQTKNTELELWKKWKAGGHKPQDLDPILSSMKRLIEKRSRIYKNNVEIPTAAIDMEHKQRVVDALKSYDPSKGNLGTWVGVYLKKANRYIVENQNFARIPETLANYIGTYQKVKESLIDELGHEPDDITLSEHTGLSLKNIKRLNKEVRKGYIQTGLSQEFLNQNELSDREREVIRLIHPRLSPDERKVHELTFGLHGNASLAPGQIAKKLKMDSSRVAKLRTSIYNKMKPFLG